MGLGLKLFSDCCYTSNDVKELLLEIRSIESLDGTNVRSALNAFKDILITLERKIEENDDE